MVVSRGTFQKVGLEAGPVLNRSEASCAKIADIRNVDHQVTFRSLIVGPKASVIK